MNKTNRRILSLGLVAGALTLSGCDILDVNNPNNLVEESVRSSQAANAVANGAMQMVAYAIPHSWQVYLMASDELTWIGSRDAWGALDVGGLEDPNNEFVDEAYPPLVQSRWMADEAIEIVSEHVNNGLDFGAALAKAYIASGVAHTVIAEIQDEATFSDKREAGAPKSGAEMVAVFDDAISRFDQAVSVARGAGETELETRALAWRARAKQSKAIRQKVQPSPNTSDPLVADAGAVQDAMTVLGMIGGTDWSWSLQYSASTDDNLMAAWINDRAEGQVGSEYVFTDPDSPKLITGISLNDPITGAPDPFLTNRINAFFVPGESWQPMRVVDERLMHLIVAEAALAGGNSAEFQTHINHIRALDGLPDFTGQIPDMDMMMHTRRTNTFLLGLRLSDMYRFGIVDDLWQSTATTLRSPGKLLPISFKELTSNCHTNGQGCSG
jgi:hypothetical protein